MAKLSLKEILEYAGYPFRCACGVDVYRLVPGTQKGYDEGRQQVIVDADGNEHEKYSSVYNPCKIDSTDNVHCD